MIINLEYINNTGANKRINVSEVEITYKNGEIVRYSKDTKYGEIIIQMSEVASILYSENRKTIDSEEKKETPKETSDSIEGNISYFQGKFHKDRILTLVETKKHKIGRIVVDFAQCCGVKFADSEEIKFMICCARDFSHEMKRQCN